MPSLIRESANRRIGITPSASPPYLPHRLPSRCGTDFVLRSPRIRVLSLDRRSSHMSSLADFPELVGFFSYSRDDDESYRGRLSALREAIQDELSAQLGRSRKNFRLWQDHEAIAPGRLWEAEIKTAVEQ